MGRRRSWVSKAALLILSFVLLALGALPGHTAKIKKQIKKPGARQRDSMKRRPSANQESKLQLFLDRIYVIDDGDLAGPGELGFRFIMRRRSHNCKRLPLEYGRTGLGVGKSVPICKEWEYWKPESVVLHLKHVKAHSGQTLDVNRRMPSLNGSVHRGENSVSQEDYLYVSVQPPDVLEVELSIFEYDPAGRRTAKGRLKASFKKESNWGIGKHVKKSKKLIPAGPEIKLHFRIQAWAPDLVLEDFSTVPAQPRGLRPETTVCVRVANQGNADSSPARATIYIDNMSQPYSDLPLIKPLAPGARRSPCGPIPTPGVGNHRVRVRLEPIFGDSRSNNNSRDKTIYWQKSR